MPQNSSALFVCPSPKNLYFNEKRLHWASAVRDQAVLRLENVHFKNSCRNNRVNLNFWAIFFLQFVTQGHCVLAFSHISIFIFGNVLLTNDVCTNTCNATSRYILVIESWIETVIKHDFPLGLLLYKLVPCNFYFLNIRQINYS